MSVLEAVRFRYLANQLSKSEKLDCIIQLINEPDEIITTALFKHFVYNETDAKNVNDMISTIIRKRDEILDEPQEHKLDMIPSPLIAHIGSFLNQWDYIDLSKSNRSIYLGCNEPNMMQQLRLYDDHECSNIKLKLYPSIKYFHLELQHFNKLSPPTTSKCIFNQLDGLKLCGDEDNIVNNETLEQFIDNNFFNLNNVTKLICSDFNGRIHPRLFTYLLSKFSELKCLKLADVACDIDVDAVKKVLPKLHAMSICQRYYQDNDIKIKLLIHALANQLERVGFSENKEIDYEFSSRAVTAWK